MNLKRASIETIATVLAGCERKADAAAALKEDIDPRVDALMHDCQSELAYREDHDYGS